MCADVELDNSVGAMADIMCQYAKDVDAVLKSRSELLGTDLRTWLSLLQSFISEPFRLSMRAAACSASVMRGILNISTATDVAIDVKSMQTILDGADAVLSYEYFYQSGLQTVKEQSNLIRNMSFVLQAYCRVATDVNVTSSVVTQPSYKSVQSRLQVTAIVLPPKPSAVTEVVIPYDSFELHIPTLEAGPYCLVSYDIAAYETRVMELLAMESFSVVPGPFLNSTAVMRVGHFVMDLSVVDVPVPRKSVDMFNVTCPGDTNSTSPFAVPCWNYSQYTVHCVDHMSAFNFYCPQNLSTNLSCSRIL